MYAREDIGEESREIRALKGWRRKIENKRRERERERSLAREMSSRNFYASRHNILLLLPATLSLSSKNFHSLYPTILPLLPSPPPAVTSATRSAFAPELVVNNPLRK